MIIVIAWATINCWRGEKTETRRIYDEETSQKKSNKPDQRSDFRFNDSLHAVLQWNCTIERFSPFSVIFVWQKLLQIGRNISHDVRPIKKTISTSKESNLHFFMIHERTFPFLTLPSLNAVLTNSLNDFLCLRLSQSKFHRKKRKPLKPNARKLNKFVSVNNETSLKILIARRK